MADNEDFAILSRGISEAAVNERTLLPFINQELKPTLQELIKLCQQFFAFPQLPIRDAAPLTDALLSSADAPPDGTLAYSLANRALWLRVSGEWGAVGDRLDVQTFSADGETYERPEGSILYHRVQMVGNGGGGGNGLSHSTTPCGGAGGGSGLLLDRLVTPGELEDGAEWTFGSPGAAATDGDDVVLASPDNGWSLTAKGGGAGESGSTTTEPNGGRFTDAALSDAEEAAHAVLLAALGLMFRGGNGEIAAGANPAPDGPWAGTNGASSNGGAGGGGASGFWDDSIEAGDGNAATGTQPGTAGTGGKGAGAGGGGGAGNDSDGGGLAGAGGVGARGAGRILTVLRSD